MSHGRSEHCGALLDAVLTMCRNGRPEVETRRAPASTRPSWPNPAGRSRCHDPGPPGRLKADVRAARCGTESVTGTLYASSWDELSASRFRNHSATYNSRFGRSLAASMRSRASLIHGSSPRRVSPWCTGQAGSALGLLLDA